MLTDNIDNLNFVENDDQIEVYWRDNGQVYKYCLTEKSDINFIKHAKELFLTKFIKDTDSFRLEFYTKVGDELLKLKEYKMTLREKSEIEILRDQVESLRKEIISLKKEISKPMNEETLISIKFSNIFVGTHNDLFCERSFDHEFLYRLENSELNLIERKTSLNNFASFGCNNPAYCSCGSYSTGAIKSELYLQKIADDIFSYGLYSRSHVANKAHIKFEDCYRLDFADEWIALKDGKLIVTLNHEKENDVIKTIPIKNGEYILNFCTIRIFNGTIV